MTGWWEWAACRGAPEATLAFGTGVEQQWFVRHYCDRCWVKAECFQAGLDEWGVWGATTEKKRGNLLGNRRQRTGGLGRTA